MAVILEFMLSDGITSRTGVFGGVTLATVVNLVAVRISTSSTYSNVVGSAVGAAVGAGPRVGLGGGDGGILTGTDVCTGPGGGMTGYSNANIEDRSKYAGIANNSNTAATTQTMNGRFLRFISRHPRHKVQI